MLGGHVANWVWLSVFSPQENKISRTFFIGCINKHSKVSSAHNSDGCHGVFNGGMFNKGWSFSRSRFDCLGLMHFSIGNFDLRKILSMSNRRKYKKNNWPSLVKFENREIWADLENRSKVVHSENFPIWRPASGDRDHVTPHVTSHVTHWGQWKYASRTWHAVSNHRWQLKVM